jgi:hypothetical protein
MSGSDQLSVVASDLISHAGHIDTAGDAIDLAKQAADITTPSTTAYGRLCWMVPQLLGQLQSAVTGGIAAGAQSLHDTAGLLRVTAGSYLSADDASAASIQRAGQRYE